MDIVPCPEPGCTAPAEVLDRWELWSTDGRLLHLKTVCLHRHVLTAPVGRPVRLGPIRSEPARENR